ncbi:MAG TPA: FAD-dependent oxidoreductase [Pyrinomonadaceae bacterium]|nr:FAD-dependent oxidoreductase [Pyrinomonadaceae bacterium]
MKRREFLVSGFSAIAGSVLTSRVIPAQTAPQRKKVIVIGAGLSGLGVAYELGKLNFDVTVLEAQSRTGGRILTWRNFNEPGLYAEAGAARIPSDHDLTLKYVREFELPLATFYPTQGKFIRVEDGRAQAVGWKEFKDAMSNLVPLDKPGSWHRIHGGNDQLPHALTKRLDGRIRYNSPVIRVEHNATGVSVKFREKDGIHSLAGDFLVSAIPFTTLAKVEFAPQLNPQKADVIRSMEYDPASRTFIETRRRVWLDHQLNGFGFDDHDSAEVWDATFGQSGTHGILQTYMRGGFSHELARKPETERVESQLARLSNMFPAARRSFVGGKSKCWSEDPWVLGAWAHPDKKKRDIGMMPEGRIFFAGEHLSDHGSWMQGALQSAFRVVNELVTASAKTFV